ncbi:hypothetical protein [Xanthomonas phage JGB6]|nr:hypothetical protein [Xanthomonas phage JGB6]
MHDTLTTAGLGWNGMVRKIFTYIYTTTHSVKFHLHTQSLEITPYENTRIRRAGTLEIQAGFSALVMENPRLTKYVNNLSPALFATCLFTLAQDFKVSEDGETVEARHGLTEATQIAKRLDSASCRCLQCAWILLRSSWSPYKKSVLRESFYT